MPFGAIDKQDVEKILKNMSGKSPRITITPGAANVATFTIQFETAEVREFELYMSTSAVGANISGTTYSTGLAATTGAVAVALTANKYLKVLTDATGKAVITLTATAKPAGEYMCVPGANGTLAVSAATVTGSYG